MKITVPAVPVAQPRQRHRVITTESGKTFAHNYTPKDDPVNSYKATVRLAARDLGLIEPIDGPVRVDIDFYLPRPKRLMRRKDPPGAIPHTAKPDRDNLEKATTDALKGLLWRDDAQICDGRVRKWYAEKDGVPRVEIEIREVEEAVS